MSGNHVNQIPDARLDQGPKRAGEWNSFLIQIDHDQPRRCGWIVADDPALYTVIEIIATRICSINRYCEIGNKH